MRNPFLDRTGVAGFIAWILLAATGIALPDRDVLVIAGAGVSQSWNTEFDLANPGPTPLTVEVGRLDVPLSEVQCPGVDPCIIAVDHRVIPQLDGGQIRVMRTAGTGLMWVSSRRSPTTGESPSARE